MNERLTELVMLICSEKNLDKKLALIEEMKEALDKEGERLKQNFQKPPA